jgi:uncharacterized protein (TIGR02271 family)
MSKTIVGLFQDRTEAERVAQTLTQAGFDRGEIHVYDQTSDTRTTRRDGGEEGSFWSWLFGADDDEDARFYSEGVQRGGTVVAVSTGDERADHARTIMERRGADVHEERTGSGMTGAASAARAGTTTRQSTGGEEVLPVVEEELQVGKREVGRGGVRVVSRVSERPVETDVRLREERVNVERRPVSRPLSDADATAFTEDTIELTETAEEPVVAKQARVVEEVVVSKDVTERTETVRDRVRRTDVQIERMDEDDFRRHWASTGASSGMTYEQCSSAYGYGCELGREEGAGGRQWSEVESEARTQWEDRNPGTWDRFKEPVRYAWDKTRGRSQRAA